MKDRSKEFPSNVRPFRNNSLLALYYIKLINLRIILFEFFSTWGTGPNHKLFYWFVRTASCHSVEHLGPLSRRAKLKIHWFSWLILAPVTASCTLTPELISSLGLVFETLTVTPSIYDDTIRTHPSPFRIALDVSSSRFCSSVTSVGIYKKDEIG